jgi:hypothetical protein
MPDGISPAWIDAAGSRGNPETTSGGFKMKFDEAAADNALFHMAREAGLEDGIDFVVSNPRHTYSDKFWTWLRKNKTEIYLQILSKSVTN